MELSLTYTPEVSDFKVRTHDDDNQCVALLTHHHVQEAEVVSFDPMLQSVHVKYSKDTLGKGRVLGL